MSAVAEPRRGRARPNGSAVMLAVSVLGCGLAASPASAQPDGVARSTNIALNRSGKFLVAANREVDSVTLFQVGGSDGLTKLAEIHVGDEPVCVAIDGERAFITNAASGTVSLVERGKSGLFNVSKDIVVGTEPRGCALTPDGRYLLVTNFTEGTVSVIDAHRLEVVDEVEVGGNPYGITVVGRTVFVNQFFARLIEGGPGEGFDDGKEGVVQAFSIDNRTHVREITLSPLEESGFTANRVNLCQQFNPAAPNNTFCPDPNATEPDDPVIAEAEAAVHPNQLKSSLACDGLLYVPNVGAQPEPPVQNVNFDTNVQALVHVVDIRSRLERTDLHVNLNEQIATEPVPADPASLDRLFGNELVAIDSDRDCDNFFIVSRGGNYVLKAQRGPDGRLDIGAPDNVVRYQTGNIPTGIVVDRGGKTAYANNSVDLSVSVIDLDGGSVSNVPSSTPPEPGSFDHARTVGQLVFFTALGVPDNGLVGMPVREINPLQFRGKQSNNAWSSCGSCHDEGLADGVTWIFGDGPRQTIPMHALYSKVNGAHDIRINNWSAARDSGTDFNNNSRGVQGGCGFASDDFDPGQCLAKGPLTVANPNIFDHGISQGASEALDFETTWLQTVRTLNAPQPENGGLDSGAAVFEENCASCHGGAKWTKSQVIYLNNPALDKAFAAGGTARDPGLRIVANQAVDYTDVRVDPDTLKFLEDVGTFDPANPIEIRQNGNAPLGGEFGFNVPSLLGVADTAPYFHNGQAQTLEEVFEQHALPGGGTIDDLAGANALLAFLEALDGRTPIFRSETDDFHEPVDRP